MNRPRILTAYCQKLCQGLLAASVLLCVFSAPASADDRQYKIEAAFLYSFFNYITWPGYDSPQALTKPEICVYGDDPIIPYLGYIRDKMAGERQLTVHVASESDQFAGCHILFVRHRVSSHVSSALPNSTLTIFKPDDPLDRWGMIELSEEEERITLKINQSQLEDNGFQVSSRLLNLAKAVH